MLLRPLVGPDANLLDDRIVGAQDRRPRYSTNASP
jgi:hypothetical protein